MTKDFFKFTPKHLEIAQTLNGNELKLWLYFSLLDPFGDREVNLPSLEEIEKATGLKKNSYYNARAKLKELGVWEFIKKKTRGFNSFCRNLLNNKSFPEKQECSHGNRESVPANRESVPANRESSPANRESIPGNWENRRLESLPCMGSRLSQTLQTIQTLSDSSDSCPSEVQGKEGGETEKEIQEKEIQEAIANCLMEESDFNNEDLANAVIESDFSQNEIKETQVITEPLPDNNNSPDCGMEQDTTGDCTVEVKERKKDEGQGTKESSNSAPCTLHSALVDDCPNSYEECPSDFLEWKAEDWARYYGYSLDKAYSNLRKCFRNPKKIKEYWEEWCERVAKLKEIESLLVEWKPGEWVTQKEYKRRMVAKSKDNSPVNPVAQELVNKVRQMFGGKSHA